ncbi:hypothetical protein [Burkholderia oklahomensis]|uniref:hypothetical protein n=1 Tax=Burkholderia oklahomensis TaxID=342113 RepID=UPI001F1A564F|nr:hypothetical protein [Burkholderia oklahomensis]
MPLRRPARALHGGRLRGLPPFRSRIVTQIAPSRSSAATSIGQTDHTQPPGVADARAAATLKRRGAIRVKPPGLTSSGNPMQRARMSRKNAVAPSGTSSPGGSPPGGSSSNPDAQKTDASPKHAQVQAHAHEADLIDLSDPPPATKPAGAQPSRLEATPAELQTVAHIPVLQPTVLHAAHAHEADLIDLGDPPPATKPASAQPSRLEATPAELQTVAHIPVLQPTVLHAAHAHEAAHATPGVHGAPPLAHTLTAAGMPSLHDIHHATGQTIAAQHAIGYANQLLAIAEMLNSFRMKLIDMIKKAVSPS